MFEFTTQTILNSVVVADVADIRSGQADPGYNVITDATKKIPEVRIGNIRFNADNVEEVQVKKHTDESLAKFEVDIQKLIDAVTEGGNDSQDGIYRIAIYLGLSMNSQDSFYANDYVYKGKPLYIEFPIGASDEAAAVAAKVKSIADKYLLLMMGHEKILKVTVQGTKVVFTGVNGYQQIKKAAVQKYHEEPCGGCNPDGFVDVLVGVPVMWTANENGVAEIKEKVYDGTAEGRALADNEFAIAPGLEAFCDYAWIIHNLRLPTLANTNFWAVTKPEMPVVGGKYTQYCIRMCKDRDGIAGEVVGQRATSVTNHVFYVLDSQAAAFEQALSAILAKKKQRADAVLKDPFAGEYSDTVEEGGQGQENN